MTIKYKKPVPTIFSLFWVILALSSHAEEKKTLVYVHPEVPVLTQVDKHGNIYDPIKQTMSAVFKEAGLDWEDSPVPIFRMYSYLHKKPEYFSILVKTPYITKCCITSENPIFSMELGVYRKPNTPKITKAASLFGKELITIEGYSYGTLKPFLADTDNMIEQNPAKNHQSAFSMLQADRAKYLLDYRGPLKKVQEERQKNGIQYDVIEILDLYFIFNKEYPDAEILVRELEKTFNDLKSASKQ